MTATEVPAVTQRPVLPAAAVAKPSPAARVIRNILALGLAQFGTWACSLVIAVLLPRFLGDVDFGKMALGGSLIGMLIILTDLGASQFLTKAIAKTDSSSGVAIYVFNALLLRVPLSLLAAVAGFAFINLLGYDGETRLVFYLLLPGLLLQTIARTLGAALAGLQEMGATAKADVATKVLAVFVMIGVVLAGEGVATLALATSLVLVVGVGMMSWSLFRRIGFSTDFKWSTSRAIMVGGMPFLLWNASLAIYGSVDIVMLSLLTNDAVVGWYTAAYRIISLPVFIPTILGAALFPAFSRLATDSREHLASMLRQALRVSLITMTPMALGMVIVPDKIVALLGWPVEFENAIPLIAILALTMPSVGVSTTLGASLMALDKQRQWALVGLTAALINPGLDIFAIPLSEDMFGNGAIGASITTVGTEYFMLSMAIFLLPRGLVGRETAGVAVRCLGAGALMMGAVWLARDFGLIPCVAVGALVYGAAVVLTRTVVKEDIGLITALIRSRARR